MPHAERTCPECGAALPADAVRGVCPRCLVRRGFESLPPENPRETIHLVLPVDAGGLPLPLLELGDYELIREIGRGGMGIIYQARQRRLDRLVALKLIRAGALARAEDIARFRTEAAAAARLQHPGIVAIHEIGEHEGQHFYSMDFVPGRSLAEALRGGPLPPAQAARCVRTVAEAIHYAHERGVLHRDLKPSNILLDAEGEPRVADFGLAKLLHSDSELTLTGAVLGSPNYMPPEQARGRHTEVSARSDVYALGAILYECLTGRPPFTAATPLETMKLVVEQDPVSPRVLNPTLPRDLETICLKCLAKEPAHRYATANDLVDELSRFLADEPIRARPASAAERGWRWCRRKPAIAALLAAGVVVPLGFVALLLGKNTEVRHEAKRAIAQETRATNALARAEAEAQRANQARAETRQNLYAADMLLAQHALDDGNLGLARRLVEAWRPSPTARSSRGNEAQIQKDQSLLTSAATSADLRGFEWRYLWQRCQGDQQHTLHGHSNAVHCVAFSRDGSLMASGDDAGKVKLWDVASRRAIATLAASGSRIVRVSFSADGKALATADETGVARVWNLATRQAVWTHEGRYPEGVQLSPAGTLIGVTHPEPKAETGKIHGSARVIDWASGKEVWRLDPPSDFEAFSADGKMAIVTCGNPNNRSELWDIESGRLARTLTNFVGYIFPSPDGRRVAMVSQLDRTQFPLIDLAEDKPWAWFRLNSGQANRLAFSPDGSLLASAGSDQTVSLWDAEAQRRVARFLGHVERVADVTFSPDGQWLATASADQTVKLWPTDWRRHTESITNVTASIPQFILSPNGRTLAGYELSLNPQNRIPIRLWLWDAITHQTTSLSQEPLLWPEFFSADGRTLFARGEVSSEGILPLLRWDVNAPTNPPQITRLNLKSTNGVWDTACAPAQPVYAVSQKGVDGISLWNPLTGEAVGRLDTLPIGKPWGFSPDGRKLVSITRANEFKVTDLTKPEKPMSGRLPASCFGHPAFSPDGRFMAIALTDRTIRLWDTTLLQEVAVLSGHQASVTDVAFSPDGRTLASCGSGVKLWSLPARREVATVSTEDPGFNFVAFTPDGNALLAGDWTGRVHIWRVPALAEIDGQP